MSLLCKQEDNPTIIQNKKSIESWFMSKIFLSIFAHRFFYGFSPFFVGPTILFSSAPGCGHVQLSQQSRFQRSWIKRSHLIWTSTIWTCLNASFSIEIWYLSMSLKHPSKAFKSPKSFCSMQRSGAPCIVQSFFVGIRQWSWSDLWQSQHPGGYSTITICNLNSHSMSQYYYYKSMT